VKSFINTTVKMANFSVIELTTELKIASLMLTRKCCPSGNKITVFSMAYESRELIQYTSIDLPGLYSGFYVNPFGEYDFYAIPHRSQQFHLLHMSLEVSESTGAVHSGRNPESTATDNNTIQLFLTCCRAQFITMNCKAFLKLNFMLCNLFTVIMLHS
jgi:hypothetical protein